MSFFYSLFRKKADGTGAEATLPITFHEDLVTLADDIAITNDLEVGNDLDVIGDADVGGDLEVTGDLTATGAITLAGITISTNDGTPEASVTGNAKGDLCMDTATGNWYTFKGTAAANTGWKLFTVAS